MRCVVQAITDRQTGRGTWPDGKVTLIPVVWFRFEIPGGAESNSPAAVSNKIKNRGLYGFSFHIHGLPDDAGGM
jgi:hypothetical protein